MFVVFKDFCSTCKRKDQITARRPMESSNSDKVALHRWSSCLFLIESAILDWKSKSNSTGHLDVRKK